MLTQRPYTTPERTPTGGYTTRPPTPPAPVADPDAPGPSSPAPSDGSGDDTEGEDAGSVASSGVTLPDKEDEGIENALITMGEEDGLDTSYVEEGYDAVRGMLGVFTATWR